jgi:hypothetical protein
MLFQSNKKTEQSGSNFLPKMLVIIILFYACEQEDINKNETVIIADGIGMDDIKSGYPDQFKDLYHFTGFIETPLWNEYEIIADSVVTWVAVPYEPIVDHIGVYLLVAIREGQTSYYIKIRNKTLPLLKNDNRQQLANVYVATAHNNVLLNGYVDNNSHFVKTDEIQLTVRSTPQLRAGGVCGSSGEVCICLCEFEGFECICDLLYGGCLPEVVIVGSSGESDEGDGYGWYDDWYLPPTLLPGSGGNNDDDGSGYGGGGGVNTGDSGNNGIVNNSNVNLDSFGKSELERILEILLEQCGYSTMYNFLTSNAYKLNSIGISTTQSSPGIYNATNNTMTFNTNTSIYEAFPEEFIHFFQNRYYSGGIGQYSNTIGHSNIEFEAKLIQDILCLIRGFGCGYFGIGNNHAIHYMEWLNIITNDGTHIPSLDDLLTKNPAWGNLNYWDFMDDFRIKISTYNYPINSNLSPVALIYLNSLCQ